MNRGLADQSVFTDHADREIVLDRVGECHEMWGIQRDGPLFLGWRQAVVVEAEAYRLAVARDIHHNPGKASLGRSPEADRWSRCRV